MKTPSEVYAVPMPIVQAGTFAFSFRAKIKKNTFEILFKWINSAWQIFVTMPDSSVRLAGCVPGVVSWSAYSDYGLLVESSLENVGQNDLSKITLYWIIW